MPVDAKIEVVLVPSTMSIAIVLALAVPLVDITNLIDLKFVITSLEVRVNFPFAAPNCTPRLGLAVSKPLALIDAVHPNSPSPTVRSLSVKVDVIVASAAKTLAVEANNAKRINQ